MISRTATSGLSAGEITLINTDPDPSQPAVTFLDVGCGFGGLSIALAPLFPENLILGMEIRVKVCDYVHQKIIALRAQSQLQNASSKLYQNVSVMRMNAQKFLPNFIRRDQLEKMFFLFPDPHFKKRKHKARIITPELLGEYAYLLKTSGKIYIATDVQELWEWMSSCLDHHPWFDRVSEEQVQADVCTQHVKYGTEESKKVQRNGGQVWMGIWSKRNYRNDMPPQISQ